MAERAAVRRRRVGAALVAVALIASSLGLSTGGVGGQESDEPPAGDASPGDGGGSGVWWDGSASLASSAPLVSASGRCESYGGWLGLFAGGSLSSVCPTGAVSDGVSLVGSPRGVGWFEGFDADGRYAGVELFAEPNVAAGVFGALGEMDVIFEGGTFSIDFSGCEHRVEAGYSSCRVVAAGVPLPPGALVGVATPGTEASPRAIVGAGASIVTPAAERATLVALYNATDGANWTRKTNWNTTAPVRNWYGVTTDSDGSVTRLFLYRNNLSGGIPVELGDLTNLRSLTLTGNELSGGIPVELGDLTNLQIIDLDRNELSGGIPVELGDLTNLEYLSLWDNELSGRIPVELGDLTNLERLRLAGNELSGGIPVELGDLTNLEWLSLWENELSGRIPAALGNLTKLRILNLHGNSLTGCVPAALAGVRSISFDPGLSYCAKPVLVGAVLVDGGAVDVVFDSTLDRTSVPPADVFSVTVDGGRRAVTAVSVSDRTVTLVLVSPVFPTETVTVSYTVPATGAKIQSPDGLTADGFSDQAVTVPPDAPALTGVEPISGGLSVSWEPVTGISAYDVEWRRDGEQSWQSTRTGPAQRYTIGGLTNGVLYWVRVRAVNTAAGTAGQTFSVPGDWSSPVPQVFGDWAPRNLRGVPDHEALIVTWDDVPVASGFVVEYWPLGMVDERAPVRAVRAGGGWFARISDLTNGEPYGIAVWSVRRALSGAVDETLRSAPETTSARPGGFSVQKVDPQFVRGGTSATVSVRLVDSDGEPFASKQMGAELRAGPTFEADATRVVSCDGGCRTDGDGYLTLVYKVATLAGAQRSDDRDLIRVYRDTGGNGRFDLARDPSATAAFDVTRGVNYVALGDSYSAGENGDFDETSENRYLTVNKADPECHRWSKAYPLVVTLPDGLVFPLSDSAERRGNTYACTGAITYNIHHDPSTGALPAWMNPKSGEDTNRPSPAAPESSDRANWEPRQAVSLDREDGVRDVDMVTLTIGGNDMGFAFFLDQCVRYRCNYDDIGGVDESGMPRELGVALNELERRVRSVLHQLKDVTGDELTGDDEAAIFVLGYPYHAPPPSQRGCRALTAEDVVGIGTDPVTSLLDRPINYLLGRPIDSLLDRLGSGVLSVDADERRVLRAVTDAVNRTIASAAGQEGVHFVDVSLRFDGHDACADGDDRWMNGAVRGGILKASDRSFHPNDKGHQEYASALSDYIDQRLNGGAERTAAGLPANPPLIMTSGARGAIAGSSGAVEEDDAAMARAMRLARRVVEASPPSSGDEEAYVFFESRYVTSRVGDCVAPAPGEDLVLSAEGFAPGSQVEVEQVGATLASEDLSLPALGSVRVDAAGRLELVWTVPPAPPALVDPVPRAYFVKATGVDASGEVLAARMWGAVGVYPATPPCAVDDAASTRLGQAVRIAVLDNDVAPSGGSWDAASLRFDHVHGAEVVADPVDGSVVFTPDPGFVGVEIFEYEVRDNWRSRVRAEVTVTVTAGCTITGTPGVVDIVGTDGDDVICVPDPEDYRAFHIIDARGGDDVVLGGDGIDWIDGGPGRDVIYGRRGADRIDGGAGVDVIFGGRGFDTVRSGDLADAIHDDAGDELDGFEVILTPPPSAPSAPVAGDDEEHAAPGEVLVIDVLGNDFDADGDLDAATLMITTPPAVGTARVLSTPELGPHVSYTAGVVAGVDTFTYLVCDRGGECATAQVTVTVGTEGCTIVGTEGDDVLRGTPGDDVICGLGGHDVLSGLGGDDILIGGAGNDGLYGGDPAGGAADDGNNVLFGGPGDDTLLGGAGGDVLWGGTGVDSMWGGAGVDVLVGGPGNDRLNGDAGDDTVWGGAGDDVLWGFPGDDTLHGGPGDDELTGNSGDDTLWGGPGADILWGHGGDDTLWGGPGDDALHGGPGGGDDTLFGNTGADTLNGGTGADRLFGGWGDDTLNGGPGADYVHGGADADTCTGGETTARCEG